MTGYLGGLDLPLPPAPQDGLKVMQDTSLSKYRERRAYRAGVCPSRPCQAELPSCTLRAPGRAWQDLASLSVLLA